MTASINIGILQKTGSRKGARYFSVAPKIAEKFPARRFAGAKKLLVPFCYPNKFKYKELFITGKPFLFDVVEFSNNSPCFFRRVYNFARLCFFRRNNPVRG